MVHFLATNFAPNSSLGSDFWDSIEPPHKTELLHGKLVNASTNGLPKLKDIQRSYGHPATDDEEKLFTATCREDFRPKTVRHPELVALFDKLNASTLTRAQRLSLGEEMPPGFALMLRQGDAEEPPHFFFVSNPVVTKPDLGDEDRLGAPVLQDVFEDEVSTKYVTDPSEPTHFMLGSMRATTFDCPLYQGRDAFAESLLPVIMPQGGAIGKKPSNGSSWQIFVSLSLIRS
mmetsp:Transcript_43730/g.105471  ORF Transcript_43730/g.105471 Transcript_43730/m.105471 type:complete len:231 (-) Transcript_43730:2375-3067(-)